LNEILAARSIGIAFFLCAALLFAEGARAAGDSSSVTGPAPSAAPASGAPTEPAAEPEPLAEARPTDKVDYFMPDVPPKAMVYDGTRWWFKPVFAWVLDYTLIDQDDTGIQQSGVQPDAGELRAGRLGGTLRSKGKLAWDFYATVDYQEKATRDGTAFDVYDMKVGIPIGPVKLDIGKMKEPICYELSGLSILLPHQERILLPFYPTRSIGVKLSGYLWGDRMTWAGGAYNDYFDSNVGKGEDGNDYVGRMTALAYESQDKRDYLHLALGYRHAGNDDGKMRFAGRPESNVIDKIVDTGSFPADHANEVSYEALYNHGPMSVLAERFDARVDSRETGFPRFHGYYTEVAWVVTGETRPYFRAQAYALGPTPDRRWGALELVGKYSHLDVTDGTLDGGLLDKWYFGANWWLSTQWKLGMGYGNGNLDKDGLRGNFKTMLFRVQWLY
jgi:phosphate-selective porin